MTAVIDRAIEFATIAHKDQVRKYTGEPYVTHPIAVSKIVATVPDHTEAMLVAAILHDTVEDTNVSLSEIEVEFGVTVAMLVSWLTDISQPGDGNRETRKAMDRAHSAEGPPSAQTIKVADLMHNTISISKEDPDFWKVYRHEKKQLLDALELADPDLRQRAYDQLERNW